MKLRLWNIVLFTLTTALLAAGCEIPADRGCVSDSECREGRFCNDGRCTGELGTSPNSENGTPNSGTENSATNAENVVPNANPNNAQNNVQPQNNVSSNNVDPQNNVDPANNENNASDRCESNEDCEGSDVCSWRDGRRREQVCQRPWACDFLGGNGTEDTCAFNWFCEEVGPLVVSCEFENIDEGECTCLIFESGEEEEFDSQNGVCIDGTTERFNSECGWRLPREEEI